MQIFVPETLVLAKLAHSKQKTSLRVRSVTAASSSPVTYVLV